MSTGITAQELLELSKGFHRLATVLGDYRYDHWDELSATQRGELESQQWTLFNTASDLNARSALARVKLLDADLAALKASTAAMQGAANKIRDVKHALAVATKAVALGGALYLAASTGNVAALAPAAAALAREIGL